ncbi:hypothetical protein QQ045_002732 [Rhodiola kirilowii]
MQARAPWGGPLEVHSVNSPTDDDQSEILDHSRSSRQLDAIQQSWLLKPQEPKNQKKYVDLGIIIVSRKFLKRTMCGLFLVAAIAGLIVLIVKTVPHSRPHPPPSVYTIALQKSLKFFDAQYSGKLPKPFDVPWRGDSGTNDGKSGGSWTVSKDLVGGFYDGGDAMKYNFPASFAMTMLSWSVIEYNSRYEAAGELQHMKAIIKWGTDYFLKTFDSQSNRTVGVIASQIGAQASPGKECWIRPEDITSPRPTAACTACSDLAGEMSAALAAASIVFKDDALYSEKLVNGSKKLFKFAREKPGRFSVGAKPTYNSTNYWDEIMWGGTWLYLATGNSSYLTVVNDRSLATKAGAFGKIEDAGVLSWDNKVAGVLLLLTRIRMFLNPGYPWEEILAPSNKQLDLIMCSYLPDFSSFQRTKGGLILLNRRKPRSLQYVVNAAFLATLYSDYLEAVGAPGWKCNGKFYSSDVLRTFSMSQIDYILGNNPQHLSYIVGYGDNYPTHVRHMGASIPKNNIRYDCKGGEHWRNSKQPNPNTIVGAMVAGPDKFDGFQDLRINPNYTEPTLAGNAGLVAALAGLSGNTTGIDRNTMFSSVNYKSFILSPPPAKPA